MSNSFKDSFRKLCLSRLKFFSKVAKIKKDKEICQKILQIIQLHNAKKILLYIPLSNEVDIGPLIKKLRKKRDIEIYVPYMKGLSFVPVKYRLPLKVKKFGIKEPNFSYYKVNNLQLDLVVVPILGIDKTYRRIGFGAGMYDRFFGTLTNKPITIFTQLKLCISNNIITAKHDIRADYIITM